MNELKHVMYKEIVFKEATDNEAICLLWKLTMAWLQCGTSATVNGFGEIQRLIGLFSDHSSFPSSLPSFFFSVSFLLLLLFFKIYLF